MPFRANAFLRHQQTRWLRPDAARWARPDAARFVKPRTDIADAYPALVRMREVAQRKHDRTIADALAHERAVFDQLRYELDSIKGELAQRKLEQKKYNEHQPRVGPGNGIISGRWTAGNDGSSSSGRPRVYITTNPDSDATGDGGFGDNLGINFGNVFADVFSDIASEIDKLDLFDIKPKRPRTGGVRLAGDVPDGLGVPGDEPPKVPEKKPKKSAQTTAVLRAITSFVRKHPTIAREIVAGLIKIHDWLDTYEDLIEADRDPPKTMQELQAGVGQRRPGYDTHHIIEQTAAKRWGLSRREIDDPSNLVSIPRLRHYQITGWYGTPSDRFNGLSPREYLSDKGPEERRRVGLEALVRFKVLKP